jgi:hypothetical protein
LKTEKKAQEMGGGLPLPSISFFRGMGGGLPSCQLSARKSIKSTYKVKKQVFPRK